MNVIFAQKKSKNELIFTFGRRFFKISDYMNHIKISEENIPAIIKMLKSENYSNENFEADYEIAVKDNDPDSDIVEAGKFESLSNVLQNYEPYSSKIIYYTFS